MGVKVLASHLPEGVTNSLKPRGAQSYTMFASEKVSEQNENCRFQPVYVRNVIAEKICQVGEIRRASGIS
jgi:hypothetical protein